MTNTNQKNNACSILNNSFIIFFFLAVSLFSVASATLISYNPGQAMAQRLFPPSGEAGGGSSSTSPTPLVPVSEYENPTYGIKMNYPSGWNQNTEPLGDDEVVDYVVEFTSGQGADLRLIFYKTGDIPLDTYNSQMYNQILNTAGSKILAYDKKEIAGVPGGGIVYLADARDTGMKVIFTQYWMKYDQGYLHFEFVANDGAAFVGMELNPASIINSVQLISSDIPGGNGGSSTPSFLDGSGSSGGSFISYENPTYGIKMNYPSGWNQNTEPLGDQQGLDYIVEFQNGTVTIGLVYKNAGNIPLDTYNSHVFSATENYPGSRIIDKSIVSIPGRPGGFIAFQYPSAGMDIMVINQWIKYGDQGYVHLIYHDPQSLRGNLTPVVRDSLTSVQLISSNNPGGNSGGGYYTSD